MHASKTKGFNQERKFAVGYEFTRKWTDDGHTVVKQNNRILYSWIMMIENVSIYLQSGSLILIGRIEASGHISIYLLK